MNKFDELKERIEAYLANIPKDSTADVHSILADLLDYADDIENHDNNGWISVDERLPSENGLYLVCYDREFNDGFYLKKIDVVDFCKPINRFSFYHDFITHWQPLPLPPKEQK